ncbi:MAG: twin-arginine translocase subunit TatC [Fuerstiella sp.]
MARNRDLFDDTTMTFGEHLEVLRTHVWRALIGLFIGVIAALFFGDTIIKILKEPIDAALRRANVPEVQDDIGSMDFKGFLKQLFYDEEEKEPEPEPEIVAPLADDELEVQVRLSDLKQMVNRLAPGTIVEPEPPGDPPAAASTKETGGENATDGDNAAGGAAAATEGAAANPATVADPVGRLIVSSPDIALFRQTARRFEKPVTYKVEEAFMTYIKVSLVSGLVLTSPWVFFQIWQFVAAGLYPHERRYVYVYLPMSIGLFVAGAVFCFYFVFPIVLDFLIGFNKWLGIEIQPRLSEYINLVLLLPVMFGISFQLPLVMLFLERIGIMTVDGYKQNWRMAILIISIASMLLTPSDPTSMMLMMVPLVFLYFGGILLCQFRPNQADPLA